MHKSIRKFGIHIVKTGSSDRDTSVIQNTVSSKFAKNVPKSTASSIDREIVKSRHEIYGSLAQKSHSYGARMPNDIDMAVTSPIDTATRINNAIIRKGIRSKIIPSKSPNAYVVQVYKGGWKDVADIHPINAHYSDYDVYGSSMPPERVGRFNVQTVKDQMYRKANSVLAKGGAKPKRLLKDETDFVTISRLRLDEKQLQAEAEIKRVRKARKSLEKIKQHIKGHKGWSRKKYPLDRDPIPEYMEQQFINFAVKNPEVDVRKINIRNKKIVSNQKRSKKIIKNFFEVNTSDMKKIYDYWTQ